MQYISSSLRISQDTNTIGKQDKFYQFVWKFEILCYFITKLQNTKGIRSIKKLIFVETMNCFHVYAKVKFGNSVGKKWSGLYIFWDKMKLWAIRQPADIMFICRYSVKHVNIFMTGYIWYCADFFLAKKMLMYIHF